MAQFASGPRSTRNPEEAIPTTVYDTERDRALKPTASDAEISDGGHLPAFLYVDRGPGAGQLLPLRQGTVVVGRASLADLRLEHSSISRRHAQLTRVGERFYVKDLGSQNGTFINGTRIATEMETQPGDEIALGNALLKLRGPLQPGDAPHVGSKASRRSGTKRSTLRVAIFAGAVGFGLAGAVMVTLFKLPAGTPAKQPVATEAPPTVLVVAPPVVTVSDEIEVEMPRRAVAPPAPEPSGEMPATVVAKKKASSRTAAAATKVSKAAPAPKKSGATARFEVGDVAGAIELATKGGDKELLAKLNRFHSAYETATAALKAKNGAAAIKNFEVARTIDEQLTGGWSKFSGELRRELSGLWTLAGLSHVEKDNQPLARKAFELALKHDPSNARAKAQLAKLGAPVVTKPGTQKAAVRNAIDDAFGD